MTQSLYIGVDGGGTYCRARLVDQDGNILGEATGDSGNPRIGIEQAWQNILGVCIEACHQGHIDVKNYANITLGLGLAGANQPQEQELVLSQPSPFGTRYLLTDAHAACLGAFSGEDGALLILGTGSCGVVYQDSVFQIIGGWGFPISDQGSGARLGLAALEQALAALDGLVPTTPFTDAINQAFRFMPEDYVQFQNSSPLPKEYGLYAKQVFQFAEKNDPVALTIIEQQIEWISRFLQRMVTSGAQQIALVGGVSQAITPYLPTTFLPYLCKPQGDAMSGAIRMAQHRIGRSQI